MSIDSVSDLSSFVYTDRLSIFSPPIQEVGVSKIKYVRHDVKNSLTDSQVLLFQINGTTDYVDLSRSHLVLSCKVTGKDGGDLPPATAPIPDGAKIGIINNFLHSIFSSVDLSMSKQLLTKNNGLYPYKAYFDTLLSTSAEAKDTINEVTMFIYDVAGEMDNLNMLSGRNSGLLNRTKYTAESNIFTMKGPLMLDLCQQPRFILSMVDLEIKLWREKPAFYFITEVAETPFKLVITEAYIDVCCVTLTPPMYMSIENSLEKGKPAIYPYLESDLRTFSIAKSSREVTFPDIFNKRVPSIMIIAFCDQEAATGSSTKNPYHFKNYNLTEIEITVNGVSLPRRSMKLKYGATQYVSNITEAFQELYKSFDAYGKQGGTGLKISLADFYAGYAIYCFQIDGHTNSIYNDSAWYCKC